MFDPESGFEVLVFEGGELTPGADGFHGMGGGGMGRLEGKDYLMRRRCGLIKVLRTFCADKNALLRRTCCGRR